MLASFECMHHVIMHTDVLSGVSSPPQHDVKQKPCWEMNGAIT